MLGRVASACVLVLWSWSATAEAQTSRDDARQHFERGSSLFTAGRFAEAAREFERTFEIAPSPLLLYNIGRAYEEDGRPDEAIAAYRRYLNAMPNAEDRAKVEEKIARLQLAPRRERPPAAAPAAPSVERSRPWRAVVPSVLGGVGLALMATSIGTGVASGAAYDRLRDTCGAPPATCPPSASGDLGDGPRLQMASIVTLAIGGAALVGGAIALGVAVKTRSAR